MDGCGRRVYGKGYCKAHHQQVWKHGLITSTYLRTKGNDIVLSEDHAEIILRNAKGDEVARAIIDINDIATSTQYTWSLHSNGYVRCMYKGKTTYLHRVLLGLTSADKEVDHVNRDKLDNRRSNLRVCEHWLNAANKGANILGICHTKRSLAKPIKAVITRKGKRYNLGYFATQGEAVEASQQFRRTIDAQLGIAVQG